MKLGLLTDIHEHLEHLGTALNRFGKEKVDHVVVIGDVFEMGERIEETCTMLSKVGAIGVWGNHDFGLSFEPTEEMLATYPTVVTEFMTSLQPRLDINGCHFTHVEPWLNPMDLADLWYFDGPPDEHRKLDRIFNAVPNRVMFVGHYHKWLLATPSGIEGWKGDCEVRLDEDDRYFVVVGALCDGQYGIFDTGTSELVPFNEK